MASIATGAEQTQTSFQTSNPHLLANPMTDAADISGYKFKHASGLTSQSYLMPVVFSALEKHFSTTSNDKKVFDLGCGNGSVGIELHHQGYKVTGVDPSIEGIAQASAKYPELDLHAGSAYEDLQSIYGQYPALISLEVVEHVYDPRTYISTLFSLVEPGGVAIISTPYHGYFKNLMIALSGKFDKHVSPLWDHGHIKFWSIASLTKLILEAGFEAPEFHRVGRAIPALAKSMVAVTKKPSN